MEDATTHGMIRVIVFREDETWVAQCIEYDIGAQANDLPTLKLRLNAVIAAEVEESVRRKAVPFAGIEPAPHCYEAMWKEGSKTVSIGKVDVQSSSGDPPVEYQWALCA